MTTVSGSAGMICPDCRTPVRVRLIDGESCPQCESSKAWERYGGGGHKLVIGQRDLAEAAVKITGEGRAILSGAAMLSFWVPALVALGFGIGASFFVLELFSHRPLGPLEPLYEATQRTSLLCAGLGFVALVIGIASTLVQKKGSLFRNAPLLVVNLTAVIAGTVTLIVGGFHWGGASGVGWAHMAMPPLAGVASTIGTLTVQEKSIMSATTVLVAPDRNGDARGVSLGSGAVIRSDSKSAFVVTCSHVAMPYASVAAFRDPKDAHPVWVYFSDGRHAEGYVVWTAEPPLDVAVVRVDIDNPPNPVPVRASADAAEQGFEVSFVPNPFRSGWTVHRGKVLKREAHRTPAGEYSLIYTSLPVQPGDSGTGLFDSLGRLVGLNTWTQMAEGGPKGISLPSNTMERIVKMMDDDELGDLEGAQGVGGGDP